MSKAFDGLNHNILIDKLVYYGVPGKSKDLLLHYLTERQQYVEIGDYMSSKQLIRTGVPQGSVLGPLLFNIFINGIIHASELFNFIFYADDTTLNYTLECYGTTTDEIESSIANELQKIFKWLDVNRLCLNVAKSKFMLFHMPQKIIPNLTFDFNEVNIEQVNEFNFLGYLLIAYGQYNDIESNWISKETKIFLFIIHSTYHIQFSYFAPHQLLIAGMGNEMSEIELLQKKAVRVVHSKFPIAHANSFFRKMNHLGVSDLYTCNLLKMYYKLYRNMLAVHFEISFQNMVIIVTI